MLIIKNYIQVSAAFRAYITFKIRIMRLSANRTLISDKITHPIRLSRSLLIHIYEMILNLNYT